MHAIDRCVLQIERINLCLMTACRCVKFLQSSIMANNFFSYIVISLTSIMAGTLTIATHLTTHCTLLHQCITAASKDQEK